MTKREVMCSTCGKPIHANVGKDVEIICDDCTYEGVKRVEGYEKKANMEIHNVQDFRSAEIIAQAKKGGEEKAESLGGRLSSYRKEKRVPAWSLASKLGISRSYLCDMEKGRRPLNQKALSLINDEEPSMCLTPLDTQGVNNASK